ncbi:MAG: L-lactate dehydrogenase [Clostridia bacterium]|nr:L-lactate dehydrogenase [Clostridia bacterium]
MSKVTIIGAGTVGSTIAYTLMLEGVSSEVLLIDILKDKAAGEAMDISQGVLFMNSANISSGDYDDAKGSDIVIITSGRGRKPGETRLDLAQTNVNIMKDIMGKIVPVCPDAVYVIVSNPVDILTYQFSKYSGLPESQVIGSGTILDTARLRSGIANHYKLNQQNIHAQVFGEHGDTSFVPWSIATIINIPIEDFEDGLSNKSIQYGKLDKEEIEHYMRTSGSNIISKKGVTNYAIAASVAHICKSIFSEVDRVMTISTMLHGEYGVSDVCLSMPCVIGRRGVISRVETKISCEEKALMHKSADSLKKVIEGIDFN